MSDFENTFREEIEKAYNHGKVGALFDVDLSLYRAIASMQGEALQLPEGDREAIEAFMLAHFSDKTFRHYIRATLAGDFAYQLANALRKLYTHAPNSASKIAEQDAEIARLTKELEEARKDADAFRKMVQHNMQVVVTQKSDSLSLGITDAKSTVTIISCKLFAEHCIQQLLAVIELQQKALQFYADGGHWDCNDTMTKETYLNDKGERATEALAIKPEDVTLVEVMEATGGGMLYTIKTKERV